MNGKTAKLCRSIATHRNTHERRVKEEWRSTNDHRARGKLRRKFELELTQPRKLEL
jgi:hypothetical protein